MSKNIKSLGDILDINFIYLPVRIIGFILGCFVGFIISSMFTLIFTLINTVNIFIDAAK